MRNSRIVGMISLLLIFILFASVLHAKPKSTRRNLSNSTTPEEAQSDSLTDPLVDTRTYKSGIGVAAKVSTLGFGFEVTKFIKPILNVRLGINYFSYGFEGTMESVAANYDVDLTMNTISLLGDYHPFKGDLHFTAGLVFNNNNAATLIKASGPYDSGYRSYSVEEIGELTIDIDYNLISPYIGVGVGNPVQFNEKWDILFEIGALYQNSPRVAMKGKGMITASAEQQPEFEKDLEGAKVFIVVSFGVSFHVF